GPTRPVPRLQRTAGSIQRAAGGSVVGNHSTVSEQLRSIRPPSPAQLLTLNLVQSTIVVHDVPARVYCGGVFVSWETSTATTSPPLTKVPMSPGVASVYGMSSR